MQISPYFILICTLVVVILLTIFATRKGMSRHAAKEVLITLILAFFALSFFGLSLLITNEKLRFVFHELKFVPLAFIAPGSVMVYCTFAKHPLPNKYKLALCVIPLLSVCTVLTNGFHHIFRKEMYIMVHNGISYVGATPSWGYWVYSAYSYLLYLAGLSVLVIYNYKRPRIYRDQTGFMILTNIAAILLSFAVVARAIPDYGDISLVTCGVVAIVQYVTIVNYSRKRVTMKAWNMVVGEYDNLVMIFDHNDKLADSNREASKINNIIKQELKHPSDPNTGIESGLIFLPESKEYYNINEKRLYDKKGRYTGRVLVVKDVSELENTAAELEFIATHDYLTGLKNRLAFHRQMQSLNESDLPVALICVNILGMKMINNIFGNEYGDRVIIRLAKELVKLTEDNDSCMRLGGDEMGIILKNANERKAEIFISQIKEQMMCTEDLIEINLEASFTVIHDTAQNAESLFSGIAETMRRRGGTYSRSISQGVMNSLQTSLIYLLDSTGHRTRRIIELCGQTADALLLSDEDKAEVRLLAAMSDIGLLSISPAIIKSKGDLSNEQWEEWKLHTIKGHNIAMTIKELAGIAGAILSHHERYDGYGYPKRIKGEEIPLSARILSAVEFYVDAPDAEACEMLRTRSGTQFDPKVTKVILSICGSEEDNKIEAISERYVI